MFDKIAEARLAELGSKFLLRRYTHWLEYTAISAVVDEDVCLPVGEGQFYLTAQHVIGVIGDSQWPKQIEETKRALLGMLTEWIGGHYTENLKKRLRVYLNALIARWEGEAIRKTSSPPASEANAVVTPIAANAVEIAIPGPGDGTAPKAVETASVQPQPATTSNVRGQGRKPGPKPDYKTAARVAEVVARTAPDGDWRPKLDEICEALDQAGIPCPSRWPYRYQAKCWSDYPEKSTAVKGIEGRLQLAKQKPKAAPETLS